MRISEFRRAVDVEFGARASSLTEDLVLASLGHRTPAQAISGGVDPREVWLALCEETDVPASRRHGVGLMEPRR